MTPLDLVRLQILIVGALLTMFALKIAALASTGAF